jgi:hypothetical protein
MKSPTKHTKGREISHSTPVSFGVFRVFRGPSKLEEKGGQLQAHLLRIFGRDPTPQVIG